jgi:hypothetical protein
MHNQYIYWSRYSSPGPTRRHSDRANDQTSLPRAPPEHAQARKHNRIVAQQVCHSPNLTRYQDIKALTHLAGIQTERTSKSSPLPTHHASASPPLCASAPLRRHRFDSLCLLIAVNPTQCTSLSLQL